MNTKRGGSVLGLILTLGLFLGCSTHSVDTSTAMTFPPVTMVCEHGAVKSLMAALHFDKEAEERGLSFRAISRGVVPYEEVPGKIARALERDGFDVSGFEPQELSDLDVAHSLRVITIGADLSTFRGEAASAALQWNDVPPASVDYEASRESLLVHIRALLDDLEKQPR